MFKMMHKEMTFAKVRNEEGERKARYSNSDAVIIGFLFCPLRA